ncbi:hypothetical protein G4G28_24115 [Massilia sp. Dwa41.01b]|uniref:hypothetical protein n=1 Tax=unclassified Massilia TaxID=2609279 RepID=UPI0015FF5074|nr:MULTISPECIES: hypothetical protein [unclassified Massilia]QNA90819.1 hypothetical protein G4G28_24115 [Massilia sp. Dwa41.01b]QNA98059.1 hypothetical protein G4G31_03205 [Massilia sp. Se16.2.3]
MESILWALDLCVVVYFCLWALKTDKRLTKEAEQAQKEAAQTAAAAPEEGKHA